MDGGMMNELMDGWMEGRKNGWIDGCREGGMDERTDGQSLLLLVSPPSSWPWVSHFFLPISLQLPSLSYRCFNPPDPFPWGPWSP